MGKCPHVAWPYGQSWMMPIVVGGNVERVNAEEGHFASGSHAQVHGPDFRGRCLVLALVLSAVFIPMRYLFGAGSTGVIYRHALPSPGRLNGASAHGDALSTDRYDPSPPGACAPTMLQAHYPQGRPTQKSALFGWFLKPQLPQIECCRSRTRRKRLCCYAQTADIPIHCVVGSVGLSSR